MPPSEVPGAGTEPAGSGRGAAGSRPDEALVDRLRAALLVFYEASARDLPWRRGCDPYAIWVSEVMLQQTRVETVVPYFERWMRLFPDVSALAGAELDDVLKAWEGLGYYGRARRLHRAAGMVRDRGGQLPDSADDLRELPGIGDYTAGAIASIAFGGREPAVDGNVRRVLARLFDRSDPSPAELHALAHDLVPPDRPGDFNQALMELGATICTPRAPSCPSCLVAADCRARALGVQEARPAPRPAREVPEAEFAVAVPRRSWPDPGRWSVALVRRPHRGMLGGLWEFPAVRLESGKPPAEAAHRVARGLGIAVATEGRALPVVDHAYTHLRARYRPYLFEVDGGCGDAVEGPADGSERRWMDAEALEEAALPRAQRRIARALLVGERA